MWANHLAHALCIRHAHKIFVRVWFLFKGSASHAVGWVTTALCLCTWDIHADSYMHSSCCLWACCAWLSILALTSQPWLGSPLSIHHSSPGKANIFTSTFLSSVQTPWLEPKYLPPPLWLSVVYLQAHCFCFAWPWSQHDMPHVPPCPRTALGLHHSSCCFSSCCCLDQASAVSRQQPWDLHCPETALRSGKKGMVW